MAHQLHSNSYSEAITNTLAVEWLMWLSWSLSMRRQLSEIAIGSVTFYIPVKHKNCFYGRVA